jgi:hypothetical protein
MLPAVMTDPFPMEAPGRTVTRPASQTSLPMTIGCGSPNSSGEGVSGVSTSAMMQ